MFSVNKKRKHKQDPSKPWLTPGIIKSIRIKKNYIKNFVKLLTQLKKVVLIKNLKITEIK